MVKENLNLQEALNLIDDKYLEIKKFIINKEPRYCEKIGEEIIFDEVDYLDRQYMIIINQRRDEVSFRDDLIDINKLWEQYSIDTDLTKPIYKSLIKNIECLGCKLKVADGGNDDYLWYDLVMECYTFDEKILKGCTEIWSDYNKKMEQMLMLNKI